MNASDRRKLEKDPEMDEVLSDLLKEIDDKTSVHFTKEQTEEIERKQAEHNRANAEVLPPMTVEELDAFLSAEDERSKEAVGLTPWVQEVEIEE